MAECRTVLWWLIFVGVAINFMARMNMSIAIVAMVKTQYNDTNTSLNLILEELQNSSTKLGLISNSTTGSTVLNTNEEYEWNEYHQNLILGASYWTYWIAMMFGGILGHRYGTKLVFGLNTVILCVLGFFIPTASVDYRILTFIRLLQGTLAGIAWPALHCITANWIPPNERSKFVTAYTGNAFGVALIFSVGGVIIHWLGWPAIFHIPAILGLLWYAAWWFLVYDSPEKHPRISEHELAYIQQKLRKEVEVVKPPTPWRSILTSVPVWVNIFALWGDMWGVNTLMTQTPSYFKFIHKWDIHMTGVLSGLPYILRVIFSYALSTLIDHLLTKNSMSRTHARKMATFICCIVQGFFILGIGLSRSNSIYAVVCLTIATVSSGAINAGPYAIFIDNSPNFAGILMGMGGMISSTTGFISPVVVSILTYKNSTINQWQLVFTVIFVMTALPGLVHLFFASSVIQEWNSPERPVNKELQRLDTVQEEDYNTVEPC